MVKTIFISLPVEELQLLIKNSVTACLADKGLSPKIQSTIVPVSTLNTDQALQFLQERGVHISKSKLYKLTASRQIPVKHFGQRLVFSPTALLSWVEMNTLDTPSSRNSTLSLARSALSKKRT